MKLAFIAQPYDRLLSPESNSIALITQYTARALADRYAITLYGKHHPLDVMPSGLPFSIREVTTPLDAHFERILRDYPRWTRRLRLDRYADAHLQYVRRIAKLLGRDRAELVHVMNYWNWCKAFKGGRRSRRKLVLEMHCEWLSQRNRDLVAAQLPFVDAVIGVSDHVVSRFRNAFPDFHGHTATVGNGVDVEKFQPVPRQAEEGRRRILFVGRVSPEKGIHTLIEAFAEVAAEFSDVDLHIVGPPWALTPDFLTSLSSDPEVTALLRFYDQWGFPQYEQHLAALVSRLGLQDRVKFAGNVPHQAVVEQYQSADLVVNASLSESFGMSMIEGMACAVPVIGTRVGGMCESVEHGVTGLLVERDSPDALAGAMCTVLGDPARARAMGVAGRRRVVEHYSWHARGRSLTNVYEKVAGTA